MSELNTIQIKALSTNLSKAKSKLNREQRRKYEREIRKVKYASTCPECGMAVRFLSKRAPDGETGLYCEVCGSEVRHGQDITHSIPPGMYLPMPLDRFDKMVEEMRAQAKEKEDSENADSEENSEKGTGRYGSKVYSKRK